LLVRFDRFKKSRFGCEKNSFLSGHSALFHFFLRTAGANFEQKYSRIDFERGTSVLVDVLHLLPTVFIRVPSLPKNRLAYELGLLEFEYVAQ
jgi:hypothetical protein